MPVPVVPCKGTVGASGDLAPLAHVALGLMGEGDMWEPASGEIGRAESVLKTAGCAALTASDGIASHFGLTGLS